MYRSSRTSIQPRCAEIDLWIARPENWRIGASTTTKRPHGAIGHKTPIMLLNHDGAAGFRYTQRATIISIAGNPTFTIMSISRPEPIKERNPPMSVSALLGPL